MRAAGGARDLWEDRLDLLLREHLITGSVVQEKRGVGAPARKRANGRDEVLGHETSVLALALRYGILGIGNLYRWIGFGIVATFRTKLAIGFPWTVAPSIAAVDARLGDIDVLT